MFANQSSHTLFTGARLTLDLKRQAKNFRVRTSVESWVRYQLPDGQTITIDTKGDGDFQDVSDSIAAGYDSDNDLARDTIAGNKLGVFSPEIFVPPKGDSKTSTEVDCELLEKGKSWSVTASSQLRRTMSI